MTDSRMPQIDSVRLGIVKVTPELAEDWLRRNTINRPINQETVTRYASAIVAGDWKLNGETLKRDRDGRIIDGQHRLLAVVKAGCPIETIVINGLPTEAQETVDRGKTRKVSDILHLRGEKNVTTLAAALLWLYKFETGTQRANAPMFWTPQVAFRILAADPGIRDMGPIVRGVSSQKLLHPGLAWALAYKFSLLDEDDADVFFERLTYGVELAWDNPILQLRNTLIRNISEVRHRQRPWISAAIAIKAWNFYRDGASVRSLRFRIGGSKPEVFPEPH